MGSKFAARSFTIAANQAEESEIIAANVSNIVGGVIIKVINDGFTLLFPCPAVLLLQDPAKVHPPWAKWRSRERASLRTASYRFKCQGFASSWHSHLASVAPAEEWALLAHFSQFNI